MQPTDDRLDQSTNATAWQPPLEADPADAQEQSRDMIDDSVDPEAPLATQPPTLDLSRASEADLAEQLYEVPFDDDGER